MPTLGGRPIRVKGGGIATAAGYLYELTGGELCLDLANTLDSRPTEEPRELLGDYDDLVRWSVQAKILTPRAARRLHRKAARHGRRAAAALRRARSLREAIFELFAASARGEAPSDAALDSLNECLPDALGRLRLAREGSGYSWAWDDRDALDTMLWPVIRSAAELLTSERLDRVRVCSAEDCDWLFVDRSKNRSRRWCDMTVCGNRRKVRRFRQVQRASGTAETQIDREAAKPGGR